jgi:hypothetical protein
MIKEGKMYNFDIGFSLKSGHIIFKPGLLIQLPDIDESEDICANRLQLQDLKLPDNIIKLAVEAFDANAYQVVIKKSKEFKKQEFFLVNFDEDNKYSIDIQIIIDAL